MKRIEELYTNLSHVSTCQTATLRLDFFKKLNGVMSELMKEHGRDEKIFRLFFDLMTLFKDMIDREPQEDEDLAEDEWLELEKSVYLLCDWEDSVGERNKI